MSEATLVTAHQPQVELVVANMVSRKGCSVAEARRLIAEQTAAAQPAPKATALPKPFVAAPISPEQETATESPTSKRSPAKGKL